MKRRQRHWYAVKDIYRIMAAQRLGYQTKGGGDHVLVLMTPAEMATLARDAAEQIHSIEPRGC